jgi:hypothetical protein
MRVLWQIRGIHRVDCRTQRRALNEAVIYKQDEDEFLHIVIRIRANARILAVKARQVALE